MSPADRLADILIRLFNVSLRPQGKCLSAALCQQLRETIADAVANSDTIDALLDDLPRVSPGERAVPVEIEDWRRRREGREYDQH